MTKTRNASPPTDDSTTDAPAIGRLPTRSRGREERRDRRDAGGAPGAAGDPRTGAPSALARSFDLRDRSASVATAVAAVRRMRLPYRPQIDAMGDLWEVMETARMLGGCKQIGALFLDPTGCGKTTAAEAMAEVACANDPEGVQTVVHCRLPASGTAVGLYANALLKLGDGYMNQARESRLLSHLVDRLQESETQLLVIDECQHGAENSGIGGQTAAAIKVLLDTGTVPVAILGTDKAVQVLAKDKELAGRLSAPSSLAPIDWFDDEGRADWTELLTQLDDALVDGKVCSTRFGLDDPQTAKKLAEACNGTIGQLMGMMRTAVREMARSKRKQLHLEDIVFGIDAWNVAYEFIPHNPFTVG